MSKNLQMEKEEIKLEALINKVNSMSLEDRQAFMNKLAIQMRLDKAKLQDLYEKGGEFSGRPIKKTLKEQGIVAYLVSHGFGGFITGAMIASNYATPEELLEHNAAAIGMLCGSVIGGIVGMFNGIMWEEKPVTNAVNGIREYINDKRINKLEHKLENNQRIADGVVELSAQGDYEDAEAYSYY